MWLLCVLPIFVILYAAIFGSLQRSAMFGKNATIVVALCTALLCIFGLYGILVRPADTDGTVASGRGIGLDFLLVPYAALALVILSVILLMFAHKILGRHEARSPRRETVRRKERSYGPKECGDRSMLHQDLRIPPASDELAKLRQSNLSDSLKKGLRNPSTSKEISR